LLLATATAPCASPEGHVVAATLAEVGKRLYAAEAGGPSTRRVLRVVTRDGRFVRAVAHHDPTALRAAIVRFFADHSLHVVRVRATTASGQLIGDVGGPFVLAPASSVVRDARGRAIGRVTLSVQDDTGYIKLMHRFTGAGVILRARAGVVPGSAISPAVPKATQATTFAVRAFPTGRLNVSLLPRSSRW
jgi:hypothetical protein